MMDRQYRRMFDQAMEQAGPDRARVDELRQSLARRCSGSEEKEVIPMKKTARSLRYVLIAAAVVALLSATAAAVAIGQQRQLGKISASNEAGVFELDGRYYFKPAADSEPIDITGQFSDTVPYVYDPGLPPDEFGNLYKYVVGGSGGHIGCVTTISDEGEAAFSGTYLVWGGDAKQVKGCPVWWRTHCRSLEEVDTNHYVTDDYRDGFDNDLPFQECYFTWSLDGLSVDGQTGAVTLRVNGEERDVTGELEDGGVYVLTVAGTERNTVYMDESLRPSAALPWNTADDPELYDQIMAYEDSRVFVPNAHDILAYRDGAEVRYAEFIYRPDGTLRYWMPCNCPDAASLGWLEDYAAQHGYELDWLMDHAYEPGTDALYDWELQDWPEWLGSYDTHEAGRAVPSKSSR